MQIWRLDDYATPGGTRSPVVLYSGEEGRAIVVGFDAGQELGEHEVREHAWLIPLAGFVDVVTAEQTIRADVGTLVHLERAERRTIRSPEPARVLLVLAPWPGPGHYPAGGVPAARGPS